MKTSKLLRSVCLTTIIIIAFAGLVVGAVGFYKTFPIEKPLDESNSLILIMAGTVILFVAGLLTIALRKQLDPAEAK